MKFDNLSGVWYWEGYFLVCTAVVYWQKNQLLIFITYVLIGYSLL